jgi:hypothetical protein
MNPKLIKGPRSAGYWFADHTTSSTFVGYDLNEGYVRDIVVDEAEHPS